MSEPTHPYTILDVFTDTPMEGNPVAVFTEGDWIAERRMQAVARELNLSETVFLLTPDDPAQADARVRIFTPGVELPFAGHPVLGTAFVVGERSGADTVRLQTGAGIVPIALTRTDGQVTFGEMSQPLPTWSAYPDPQAVLEALGVTGSELPIEVYDNGPEHLYVTLADVASVAALRPDFAALSEVSVVGVSCFAVDGTNVRTRMFAPGAGVFEDPATGSAAGPLAVHLARHGRIEYGQTITITQGVEIGRPSQLFACAYGTDERLVRVTVGGSAVAVAKGHYLI